MMTLNIVVLIARAEDDWSDWIPSKQVVANDDRVGVLAEYNSNGADAALYKPSQSIAAVVALTSSCRD